MAGQDTDGVQTEVDLTAAREEQAAPEVRALFGEIAETLRVPFPGLFWRVLATGPALLRAAWDVVAPALRSVALERAADRLRGRALIREAAEMSSHQAFKGDLVRVEIDYDLRDKINNFNHIALYALPKHLLALVLLERALAGETDPRAEGDGEIARGIAAGAVPVSPLDPAMARGRAAELLPVIAAGHGHPAPEDYFRSLARLPDYLGAAWNALKPVVRDPEYDARGQELVELARAEAARLPLHSKLILDDGQRERLAALVRLFAEQMLPDTLMDAAIVTTLTDGPDLAGFCRYALPAD